MCAYIYYICFRPSYLEKSVLSEGRVQSGFPVPFLDTSYEKGLQAIEHTLFLNIFCVTGTALFAEYMHE